MLAGIFATKKRAACFATLRAKKRRRAGHREPDEPDFAQPTERRRQSQLSPPTLNGSNCSRRFETGRPLRALALSNYPSNCYGFAGGVAADGDDSAAGDAILSLLADFL
jgi:hypothetical protein